MSPYKYAMSNLIQINFFNPSYMNITKYQVLSGKHLGSNVLKFVVVLVCFIPHGESSAEFGEWSQERCQHYNDVTMGSMASQITSLTIVYSAVYWSADQRKHQSSASLAFVRGIHRGPVNSPHKWQVTRKMFHLMTSSWIFRAQGQLSSPRCPQSIITVQ